RRALQPAELAAINTAAGTTGNDTPLDTLILRLHTETACRRAAALTLTPDDIDPEWCLLRLHEKNNLVRWQPASPTLITALLDHHTRRGPGNPTEPLLRYRDGSPITTRRYDHLWHRIGLHLPWVTKQGITTHWLRHTTLTWVERHYGYAIAHAYAGHHDHTDTATPTYLHADIHDLATALAALTGEPHPLAPVPGSIDISPPLKRSSRTRDVQRMATPRIRSNCQYLWIAGVQGARSQWSRTAMSSTVRPRDGGT
ncbi:site-specific integrase, partial [Amycolatopsis sp. K13G38]